MKAIIWPVYVDSKKSKHEGRKIPMDDAVDSPKLREISKAANKLGLNPEVEKINHIPDRGGKFLAG